MSLKKNISSFRKDWLAQSTSNRPLVIIPEGEPEFITPKNNKQRLTELDLKLDYIRDVGGQHRQGQVGELYRLQLTGYSRWIEEKLLELLNQK